MNQTSILKQNLTDIADFAADLARRAGDIVKQERQHATYKTSFKSNEEMVTSADVTVDEFISEHILNHYPGHQILSEEGMHDLVHLKDSKPPLWVVDPIDGTVNFAYGHNQVAVSIAYFEGGEAKAGVVYAPFQNELFCAIRDRFAVLNQQPIRVSEQTDFRKALIATGFPYHKNTVQELINRLQLVLSHCRDIRRIGSAALDICWVAMGRLDGYYETLSPWDFAAAQLVAKEAGARCGRLYPAPADIPEELFGENIIISTPRIYDRLRDLLTEADASLRVT